MWNYIAAKVNLSHIRRNLENIRTAIGPDRKILVCVKADAYGHGAVEVARLAEKIGIHWLGVASVAEGMELRQAGIKLPILKFLTVFPEEMKEAVEADLAFVVCEKQNIIALNETCKAVGKKANVHLKIDTGMGRIGCTPEEAPDLAQLIGEMPFLFMEGVCSHLPVSDESSKTFTQRQITNFKKVVDAVEKRLNGTIPLVHCSNSGAILAHPEGWFNLVRPGVMVYGFYPSAEVPQTVELAPAMTLSTHVSFVKKVSKGTSIGYGRTWVASEDTHIATFSAGYADGFNRLFSNKGRILIKGKSYPVVGRVCMDQSMANLGPKTEVKAGDEVVLIGSSGEETISVDEWAEKLDTITYEVTCRISNRVKRVYEGG